MNLMDSVEKTISRHFATLTKEAFDYKGKTFSPKVLIVSPLLLRGVCCVPNCGGCCRRFTLDWLPDEKGNLEKYKYPMDRVKERKIEFNGKKIPILSDLQDDHTDYWCRNLNPTNGRCGVHEFSPYSCDFELIRTIQTREDLPNRLTQKLFGRGWAMKRVTDHKRGALCYMTPVTQETIDSVIRRMKRFQDWADHFGIETWAPEIIGLIERKQLTDQIQLDPFAEKKGFGL